MFVEIWSARDPINAELLKGLLEENGFHPPDIRLAANVYLAGVDQTCFIEVPVSEAAGARKCLADYGYEAALL
jgi:hypothetical protein